jgi:metal-responsive CopG/Arc/MetJ family transcriptional regulator
LIEERLTMAQIAPETVKKYRVQLDFSEEAFRELNDLVAKLRVSSRAELIRDALGVLKWIYRKKVEQQCEVVAIGKDEKVYEPEFSFIPEGK